ncbi:hypothetical protein N9Y42_05615 [Mariniblastus sp.]|nr:hypothetical protein [Mariniblastus sp.]
MNRIFDGKLYVAYSQAYIHADEDADFLDEDGFAGQKNGLCGAALTNSLFLITGLNTGHVNFSIDLCDSEPPIDPTWEEVVETPFNLTMSDFMIDFGLYNWDYELVVPIPLNIGTYRVRYSAKGMERGRTKDTILSDEEPVDSYLLEFWASPLKPDAIIKQTSDIAAYWHNAINELGAE